MRLFYEFHLKSLTQMKMIDFTINLNDDAEVLL